MQKMKFKRLMNFRPILLVALTLILSSAIATFVCVKTNTKLIVGLSFLGLALLLLVLYFLLKKKFLIFATSFVLIFSLSFINLYFRAKTYDNYLRFNDKNIFVSGVICDNISTTTSGNIAITLSNVYIISDDYECHVNGKVKIYTSFGYFDDSELAVGRKIEAFGSLNFKSISSNLDKYVGNFSKGEIAGGFISHSNITLLDSYSKTLKNTVKSKTISIIRNSGTKHAEVGYGMMFGDTSLIDSDIKSIFQETGIAHLLAVSGLHVSVIAFVINFILSKFRLSKKSNLAVISVLLLFYSYLCSFSVSVVRASLMSVLIIYSEARGKPYDKLSVLSLVASILLLINPLYLFNLSFVLSFVAVLSIFLLSKPVQRLFEKITYNKMASSLGLNIAVQFGLFAFSVYFFGKFEALSLLCNVITVPIAVVAFVILIASAFVSAILPFMSFLCKGYGFLMDIVIKFNYAVSRIGWTLRFGSFSFAVLIISVLMMFALSDYIFASKKIKAGASAVCLSLIAVIMMI